MSEHGLEPWWKEPTGTGTPVYAVGDAEAGEEPAAADMRWYWCNLESLSCTTHLYFKRRHWMLCGIRTIGPCGGVYVLGLGPLALEFAFEGEGVPRPGRLNRLLSIKVTPHV